MNTVEYCWHHVPAWLSEFLEVNDFSAQAALIICRLYGFVQVGNALELVSTLMDVVDGRLPLRNCGWRMRAEIAEKIGYHS